MVFYLQPDSNDMFIMDMSMSPLKFIREKIQGSRIPFKFATQQTPDGKIFMIGGFNVNQGLASPVSSCVMIDESLRALEMDSMQSPRFDIPLALVHDRFILAIGGKTSNAANGKTRRCEAYDTVSNHWFQIDSLPALTVDTSAVVLNKREVYLMPGTQNAQQRQQVASVTICRLDSGPASQFPKTSESNILAKNFGYAISQYQWTKLEVRNAEFVSCAPTSGVPLSATSMLVFGGNSTKCFKMDVSRASESIVTMMATKS